MSFGVLTAGVVGIGYASCAITGTECGSDGWFALTIALAIWGLVSGGSVVPHLMRYHVIAILVILVIASLIAGAAGLASDGSSAIYTLNDRTLFGSQQLAGIAGHPNLLALIASLCAALGWQMTRRAYAVVGLNGGLLVFAVAVAPALVAVFWSQSRTGMAILLVGLIGLLIPIAGKLGRLLSVAFLLVCAAIAWLPPVVAQFNEISFHGRIVAWEMAADSLRSSPLLGGGPAVFLNDSRWVGEWSPAHAHNVFHQQLASAGLIGLLLLFAALGIAGWIAVRFRSIDDRWSMVSIALLLTYGALEPSFGVGSSPISFIPIVLAATVIGAAPSLDEWRSRKGGKKNAQTASASPRPFIDARPSSGSL